MSSEPEELGGNHAMDLWRMQCLDAIPSEADFEAFTPQQRKREHEHVGVGINDLTALLFTYLLIAYKWIVFFVSPGLFIMSVVFHLCLTYVIVKSRNALEIAAVSTYVTGFWEVIQTQKVDNDHIQMLHRLTGTKLFSPIVPLWAGSFSKSIRTYMLRQRIRTQ